MDFITQDLASVVRSLGRGLVFRAPRFDPGGGVPLVFAHLGDSEGEIKFTPNAEVSHLTLPEHTGPAIHEAEATGENPVAEIPLYVGDAALLATLSPRGSASGGHTSRGPVAEHTLVLFPEDLLRKTDGTVGTLSHAGAGAFTLDGVALDSAQLALLATSVWLWRCYFARPPRRFIGGTGDAKKQIETVTVQLMHHPDMPEGHALFTTGNPYAAGIDIEGGS